MTFVAIGPSKYVPCSSLLFPTLFAPSLPMRRISTFQSRVHRRCHVFRLPLLFVTFDQASTVRLHRRHRPRQRLFIPIMASNPNKVSYLICTDCGVYAPRPCASTRAGMNSLARLTSFPIRVRPRAVRRELEVSAQELCSSPSTCITLSHLPSRSQDAMYLSPGHWPLCLVPEGWSTTVRPPSCLYGLDLDMRQFI